MPRKARVLMPRCPHHIVQRRHNRNAVFLADQDYRFREGRCAAKTPLPCVCRKWGSGIGETVFRGVGQQKSTDGQPALCRRGGAEIGIEGGNERAG